MKRLVLVYLISISIIGCARNRGTDVYTPAIIAEEDSIHGGQMNFELNPKVDILFVIDNSESMLSAQEKLQKASDLFVDGFGENSLIDYRVGVITVYDSRRCGNEDKNGKIIECYPEGRLRTPFITRGNGAKDNIRAAINVGVLPLSQGGPRFEELFSPILTAFTPELNHANDNFIRSDSKVVVIMVTDEDDSSSSISVDNFLFQLRESLGARINLYGVVATPECPRKSYADKPDRISSAVAQMNGRTYPICDASFGKHLAGIGSDIREKLMKQEIVLQAIPQSGTLQLFYGDKLVPPGRGWYYHPRTQTIYLNSNLNVAFKPNTHFSVRYTRVEDRTIEKGRAIPRVSGTLRP